MRRPIAYLAALVCLCALGACTTEQQPDLEARAPEPDPGLTEPVAGTYRLVRVADRPLPVSIAPDGDCLRALRDATLTISDTDQNYSLEAEVARECPGEAAEAQSMTETGNYILTGSTIHFTDELDADEALQQPFTQEGVAPDAFTLETFAGDGTIGEGDTLTVMQPGNWTLTFAPVSVAQ